MIDIPSNLTDGNSVYLGDKRFVYNGGKLVPYVVTNVGTELPSPKLGIEVLTTERHSVSGKPLYVKTIDFGTLPNATTKTVTHSVANIEHIYIDEANSYASSSANTSPINYPHELDSIYNWYAACDKTTVWMKCRFDRTNFSAIITIRYTKTTDTPNSPIKSLYTGSLNEIRQNVETLAGYKRNGKDVYQIEVDFGFLPNATTKSVVVPILEPTYTCWIDNSNSYIYAGDLHNEYYPLNMPSPANITHQIGCWVSPKTKSVNVATGINRSAQPAKIVVNYTK